MFEFSDIMDQQFTKQAGYRIEQAFAAIDGSLFRLVQVTGNDRHIRLGNGLINQALRE